MPIVSYFLFFTFYLPHTTSLNYTFFAIAVTTIVAGKSIQFSMLKKLSGKLRNKHFLSLSGNAVMSVLSMVTIAILCRKISIAAFGSWIFFQGTLTFIDLFRSGFLTTAFIKFYSGAETRRAEEVVGSTWYLALMITAVVTLLNIPAILLSGHIGNEGLRLFARWAGVSFWVMLPYFMVNCLVQGDQRFDRLLVLRFINQIVFLGGIVVLGFFNQLSLSMLLYVYLLSYAVPGIWVLFNGWSRIHLLPKRSSVMNRELFHFGKYSVGTNLGTNLFRISDTWIINFLLGPGVLAIYNIGGRPMELVEIPLRSFVSTGMPELSAAYNGGHKKEVIAIMKRYAGMLTWVLVPFGIIAVICANIGIGIIGGPEYQNTLAGAQAANVFRLFMTFALLYPLDRFMALTLDVIHRPKVNFIKVLVMVAVNVVFDFVGIGIFKNIYGVALASVAPTITGVCIGFWALNKYHRFSFKSVYTIGYQGVLKLLRTGRKQMQLGR